MLDLDLPYGSSTLQLHLEVNADLFSPDWFAESWDDAGELLGRVDNPADYMCHYLGFVLGMPDSVVALSVCDGIGIQGRIASLNAGLDLGVHATDMSLRVVEHVGEHIIYNMTSVMVDVEFGEVHPENEGGGHMVEPHNNPTTENLQAGCSNTCHFAFDGLCDDGGPGSDYSCCALGTDCADCGDRGSGGGHRYVNDAVFASSRQRLDTFSNNNQELTSTQSDVNTALSHYLSNQSRWNGDPPTHAIWRQVQNPSQWSGTRAIRPSKAIRFKNAETIREIIGRTRTISSA